MKVAVVGATGLVGEWTQVKNGTIHRAACRFYYGNTEGLTTPNNSRKEKIGYFHREQVNGNNGDYCQQYGMGVWTDIRIFGKNNSRWRELSEIFSTTSHELGHAAHYTNAKYNDSETRLIESWARCVQYHLTNIEYTELGIYNSLNDYDTLKFIGANSTDISRIFIIPDIKYNFQLWDTIKSSKKYTPLFIDLIDNFNQNLYYRYKGYDSTMVIKYPFDNVSIPIHIVESLVFNSKSFDDIKNKLIKLYDEDKENINKLFSYYE